MLAPDLNLSTIEEAIDMAFGSANFDQVDGWLLLEGRRNLFCFSADPLPIYNLRPVKKTYQTCFPPFQPSMVKLLRI